MALEENPKLLAVRDEIGASPLHYASSRGQVHAIKVIVHATGLQGEELCYFSSVLGPAINSRCPFDQKSIQKHQVELYIQIPSKCVSVKSELCI